MSINMINEEILRSIKSDKKFNEELSEFLNFVIDEEIAKGDEMDDELVSECVDALMELEQGDIDSAIEKLGGSKKIIKFVHKKNFAATQTKRNIAVAAAVVMLLNSVTYVAVPAYATAVNSFVQEIFDILDSSSEETDDGSDLYSQITVETPENINLNVHSKSEADLGDSRVFATDYDGNETEIPLKDCKIKKHIVTKNGKKFVEVSVSYKGHTDIVEFNLV